VPDDDDDAASAASFDPEKAGSKVASEKSFDPDRVEDEQDLSGFEDEAKESVATISADIAQRVHAVWLLAWGLGVGGNTCGSGGGKTARGRLCASFRV
jgi:hypothetical protein